MRVRNNPDPIRRGALVAAAAAVIGASAAWVSAQPAETAANPMRMLVVGDFAAAPVGTLPPEWSALTFRGITSYTRYAVVADAAVGQAVMATANASASALVRRITADTSAFPILRWQWKVDNLIDKADIARREGDDYPARIYVSFRYDPQHATFVERAQYGAMRLIYGEYPPHSGINYVWDGKAPEGTVVPNQHTPRMAMIVVESGAAHLQQWRSYERNIVADYRRAFGRDPPPISGVAIMTDADNTGQSATAWYGNIALHSARR